MLYTYRYPTENIKGVVILFHGWSAHSDSLVHIGKFFADRGYEAYSFDYIGRGRSDGKFGFTYDKEILISDCT